MEYRTCANCGESKPVEEFNWRWVDKGIRQSYCRDCSKIKRSDHYQLHREEEIARTYEVTKDRRKRSRQFVWDYLSTHPCTKCGESDPVVLEFHHLHGKDRAVSELAGEGWSIERLLTEIEKCVVLCSNCHRKVTAEERGYYKDRT